MFNKELLQELADEFAEMNNNKKTNAADLELQKKLIITTFMRNCGYDYNYENYMYIKNQ